MKLLRLFSPLILLIIIISAFGSTTTFAIEKGKLRGFVTDSTSGEVIGYASVFLKGTTLGTTTNNRGYYFIPSIPAGSYTVVVSYIGFQTREQQVAITGNGIFQLDIKLVPTSIRMREVSVIGEKSVRVNETDLGLDKISTGDITSLPGGFEADIFKVLQTAPGVSATGDVTARYYVRGGTSNQNLVILNDVIIYNPFHALGIYSVIDPDMISMAEFYKGGFGPEFGERLSSVLNVVTKDGNRNNFRTTATAGLLSGKASFEGPIPWGSFLFTGRKSYYTKVLNKYLNGQDAPFDFYDLSYKVNFADPSLLKNGKFVLHGFFTGDRINNNDPDRADYNLTNNIIGLNWYQIWASPLYSFISFSSSTFQAEVLPNLSKTKSRDNKVRDLSTNWNFTYIYDSKDELAFGLINKYLSTKLNMENTYLMRTEFSKQGHEMSGYCNYKFYRYETIGLNLGMRVNFISIAKLRPFLLEPRLSITYRPNPLLSLKASVSRHSQEITTLSDETELISIFEPWTIIPDNVAAAEATQLSAGLETYLNENFSLEMETYYKSLTNLTEINRKKFMPTDPDYINVEGESYGLESLLKYQSASLFMKASYTLSWSYKIGDKGRYFPRYDVRHSANILANLNLGAEWYFNVTWTFNSGMPFYPISGFYNTMQIQNPWLTGYELQAYKAITMWERDNIKRLPYYHRLDLGITKNFSIGPFNFETSVSALNVYDRKNIFYLDRDTGRKVYMLPFLPSFSIKAEL
ncbi:MAG: TonB-dependent receptor [Ignavibacteriales bacterium]